MLAGLILYLSLCGDPAAAQPGASISGFVRDATSGETLLMANVVLEGTAYGTAANSAGYYTLPDVPPGTYTVVGSYIGFADARVELTLAPGERRRLDLELAPDDYLIDEVTVEAERVGEEEARRLGAAQLQTDVVRRIPAVLEPDVFRSLQLLPGIKAASDYSSGLYIRGGSPDQTLILLDRTTVYNPTHFFGFFSTFNPDAIKDVRLYKGGYPAEYGGRLGSVVDIYNKHGNRRQTEGSLSLGLLASRALAEGPYARGSWMLAARRSTLEPLLALLRAADVDGIPDGFYFYDVNGKLNFDAGANDRFSLAFYTGNDALRIGLFDDAAADIAYGNRTISGDWSHIFSQRLFANATLTASRYANEPVIRVAGTAVAQENRVYDTSARADFEFIPNDRYRLEGGLWGGAQTFVFRRLFDGREALGVHRRSTYGSLYLQQSYRPSPLWSVQAGLRAAYFSQGRYARLEPRLTVEHLAGGLRLQAGYGRYYQFLTLVTSELFSGFDTWLTTAPGVPPAYGDQLVAGLKTRLRRDVALDLEVYYRTMRDLFEFDPRLPDVAGMAYADIFRFGEGFAYGAEVLVRKPEGRLNGFVGYTFGRTRRRFPDVNDGRYYIPKYDRTHDLNVVANFDLSRSWRLTGVFVYATGQSYTRPTAQFKLHDDPFDEDLVGVLVTEYDARLPAYHRLDLGASRRGRLFGAADYELQLQVINALYRRNVWFYFFDFTRENTIDRVEVPQIPVPIPNVSLTLRF